MTTSLRSLLFVLLISVFVSAGTFTASADTNDIDCDDETGGGRNQQTLTVTMKADNKAYDGTAEATITLSDDRVEGDDVTVNYPTEGDGRPLFDGIDAGSHSVQVCELSLSGKDAHKYKLADTCMSDEAEITPYELTVTATAEDKTYDGTTDAVVSYEYSVLEGDDVTVEGTANFEDKNVGSEKEVNITGITLSGEDADNYTSNDTALGYANINKRDLLVTAEGVDKVFDGTMNATVIFSDDRVEGDSFTVTGTATFADAALGTNKPVSVSNISLSGTDANNYSPNETTNTTASITAKRSSGGSSSGSHSSKPKPIVLGATTSIPVTNTTTGNGHGGGSANLSHQFLYDLYMGMWDPDVTLLQQILIDHGYLLLPAPTGYFGPLTFAAVMKYQTAHPEIGFITGYVGPFTRGVLNQGIY